MFGGQTPRRGLGRGLTEPSPTVHQTHRGRWAWHAGNCTTESANLGSSSAQFTSSREVQWGKTPDLRHNVSGVLEYLGGWRTESVDHHFQHILMTPSIAVQAKRPRHSIKLYALVLCILKRSFNNIDTCALYTLYLPRITSTGVTYVERHKDTSKIRLCWVKWSLGIHESRNKDSVRIYSFGIRIRAEHGEITRASR